MMQRLEVIVVFGSCDRDERESFRKSARHAFFIDLCDCHKDGIRFRTNADLAPLDVMFFDPPGTKGRPNSSLLAATRYVKGKCCPSVERQRDALFDACLSNALTMATCVSNSTIDGWMCVENMIVNSPLLLTRPDMSHFFGSFDCPAIAIGSGPSVADHLEDIRRLNSKFLIFCAESAAQGLVKAGIRPHFICPQERVMSPFLPKMKEWGPPDWRPWCICTPQVHPASLSPFQGRVVPVASINQPWEWYWRFHGERKPTIEGSSTGVAAVTFAALMTRGPVYLVGNDCAYDDDESHWGGASETASLWDRDAGGGSRICGYDTVEIDRNGGGKVRSCHLWSRFAGEIGARGSEMRRKGRTLVNTNINRGAVIPCTICERLPTNAESLRNFQMTRKVEHVDLTGPFKEWVEATVQMLDECRAPPYRSKTGNQAAINMVLGCLDSCCNYWRRWDSVEGRTARYKQAKRQMQRASMERIYPSLERAIEWIRNKPQEYAESLRNATRSATDAR